MANNQKSFFEKAQAWWETDNAKAIATIIAVLLIPAAVVAWNYASNRDVAFEEQQQTEEQDVMESNSNDEDNGEAMMEDSSDESEQIAEQAETTMQDTSIQEEQEVSEDPAVGGIENVETLPDTSADGIYEYTVQKGDNVYKISREVCGNDSFYLSNLYRNYLKVGSVVTVNCN